MGAMKMHDHAHFKALPVEILERVLLMVHDALTVYRCRQVSQAFRTTIDGSTQIKRGILFLEPDRSTIPVNLLPQLDGDCCCLSCARRPAVAICNDIIISSSPKIRFGCTAPADVQSRLVFTNDSTLRPLRYPVSLERLGLNGSTLSDLEWPSNFGAMKDSPLFNMQLSSPPCQTVVVYDDESEAHFRIGNPDGVRYSDVISQAWSYARKELEVIHRGRCTRLKKQLIDERRLALERELRYMQVYIMDVAALG